jgi:hypothetical protein
MEVKIHSSVGELIEALKAVDPNAIPFATEPPFTGVRLIHQADGNVLISPPPREPDEAEEAAEV